MPEEVEDHALKELAALRSDAMLAHPALKFDKLMFFKRPQGFHRKHLYGQQNATRHRAAASASSRPCHRKARSPRLVPELDGGIFDRFDLSFDAKKVVFGYKKETQIRASASTRSTSTRWPEDGPGQPAAAHLRR